MIFNILRIKEAVTFGAIVAINRAVQLKNSLTARNLMKPIDVLGDYCRQLSNLFKLSKCFVGFVRLRIGKEKEIFIVLKEDIRLP